MCGEERDKAALIKISVGHGGGGSGIDVCQACQDRKIAELVAVAGRGTQWQ